MAKIEHIFVLMLENRSFDHMLAFSGLKGIAPPPSKFGFTPGAVDQLDSDPPHEHADVAAQINGGAMDGFLKTGGQEAMLGFDASEVPILVELARNNLCFDNWFSSLPGPTWPNRLFAHAASSGGLENSLSTLDDVVTVTQPDRHLRFEHGHIFDRLTAAGVPWRIYHHHFTPLDLDLPQVLSLKGMVDKRKNPIFFRPFTSFADDMRRGDVTRYTFIEPAYGLPSYSHGNSQHPTGTISLGELLIRNTYEAIFTQKVGANSALLITYDEHGGFFDHVPPPAAVPPGDQPLNHDRGENPGSFKFDRFGVRVPAVLVSPWLPAGLGSDLFGPQAAFDHSSIVKALRTTFSLGDALTKRDEASPDWNTQLLATPRTLKAKFPVIKPPKFRVRSPSEDAIALSKPSGTLLGFAQIAADIDWHTAERLRKPPLIASYFPNGFTGSNQIRPLVSGEDTDRRDPPSGNLALLQYIRAVQARDAELDTVPSRMV